MYIYEYLRVLIILQLAFIVICKYGIFLGED